jgi:beta-glucosidase
MKKTLQTLILGLTITSYCFSQDQPAYKNTFLSFDERVADLVSQMTIEEKIRQMSNFTDSIPRLGIKKYNYAGEASHGISEDEGGLIGKASSFPQLIAMGSTWNPDLMQEIMDAVASEARAYHNAKGKGLTYWSPTINMLRDPRWGRNDEAFSEDPYLMSRMAVAYVKGLQGNHPKYLKTVATPKHFVANNSEYNRHHGSSDIAERWLREYYFPAFKACFIEGGAYSTMGAYNSLNGIPACVNKWLLTDVLRKEWGFQGYVVSDCGAVSYIVHRHKYTANQEEAVAAVLKAGLDLECETSKDENSLFDKYLKKAYMKLGEFDKEEDVPYNKISMEVVDCKEHREIALRSAREAMVLLKNENNFLPLDKNKVKKIAVIGKLANENERGGYSGMPAYAFSLLNGIRNKVGPDVEVNYAYGCFVGNPDSPWHNQEEEIEEEEIEENQIEEEEIEEEMWDKEEVPEMTDDEAIAQAVELAKKSDIVILAAGTNEEIAMEDTDAENLEWPNRQLELIKRVVAANPNVVLVMINGYPISINWEKENVPAILEAWFAGQEQGTAMADIIFGDYNPGGKLPVTFYKSTNDLPHISDYDITKGRTYWFYDKEIIYPFGYGLSYTTFELSDLIISKKDVEVADEDFTISVSLNIKNTGTYKGDEVVQLYVKDVEHTEIQANKKLREFKRISVNAGEKTKVTFELNADDFSYWSETTNSWQIEPGDFEIQVGTSSEDIKLIEIVTAKQ